MTLCCVQLFCAGQVSDSLEVWRAKTASWDANISIDIQLLCGAGLGPTKQYLAAVKTDEAAAALNRLIGSEEGATSTVSRSLNTSPTRRNTTRSGLTRSVGQEPASGEPCGHSLTLAQVHFCSVPQMQ